MSLKRGVVSGMLQFSHAVRFFDGLIEIRSRDLYTLPFNRKPAIASSMPLAQAVFLDIRTKFRAHVAFFPQAAASLSTGGLSGIVRCWPSLVGEKGTRIVEQQPRPRSLSTVKSPPIKRQSLWVSGNPSPGSSP
jgi:hypothetical protein